MEKIAKSPIETNQNFQINESIKTDEEKTS